MTPEPSYREIPLTQGQVAKVSPEDFVLLSQWKWHAYWNANTRSFYAVRKLPRTPDTPRVQVWMHRQVLGLEYGDRRQGDHHNHDTLDNQRHNLRVATRQQQQANIRTQKNNQWGLKGVSYERRTGRWTSSIMHARKVIHLGTFATAELAHAAYCKAASELKGEFACRG
jgi:hypothetical protein